MSLLEMTPERSEEIMALIKGGGPKDYRAMLSKPCLGDSLTIDLQGEWQDRVFLEREESGYSSVFCDNAGGKRKMSEGYVREVLEILAKNPEDPRAAHKLGALRPPSR